jgi:hypothetical protein
MALLIAMIIAPGWVICAMGRSPRSALRSAVSGRCRASLRKVSIDRAVAREFQREHPCPLAGQLRRASFGFKPPMANHSRGEG